MGMGEVQVKGNTKEGEKGSEVQGCTMREKTVLGRIEGRLRAAPDGSCPVLRKSGGQVEFRGAHTHIHICIYIYIYYM